MLSKTLLTLTFSKAISCVWLLCVFCLTRLLDSALLYLLFQHWSAKHIQQFIAASTMCMLEYMDKDGRTERYSYSMFWLLFLSNIFLIHIWVEQKSLKQNCFSHICLISPDKIVNQTSKKISMKNIRKTLAVTCIQQMLK